MGSGQGGREGGAKAEGRSGQRHRRSVTDGPGTCCKWALTVGTWQMLDVDVWEAGPVSGQGLGAAWKCVAGTLCGCVVVCGRQVLYMDAWQADAESGPVVDMVSGHMVGRRCMWARGRQVLGVGTWKAGPEAGEK